MKLLVIGSSRAGHEVFQTVLQEQQEAKIQLYEKEATVSFLSCGIQSYLEDVSNSLHELNDANEISYIKQGVHVHTNSEGIGIHSKNENDHCKNNRS